MSLYQYLLFYLTAYVNQTLRNERGCWKHSKDVCCKETCQKYLTEGGGLFCANVSFERGAFAACHSVWCPECFKPIGMIQVGHDDDGEELTRVGDEQRFLEARRGDHMMCPFHCPLCHFRNIMKRDPWVEDELDTEIMEFIVRACLDAFWGRDSTTVEKNLTEARRTERTSTRLQMPSVTPPMGPFPLTDDFGMQAAIAILDRSMDPGKHAEFVQ
jgi:hypothetical protein